MMGDVSDKYPNKEQMKEPAGRFINNMVALIWLKLESMLTETWGGGVLVSFSNTINPNQLLWPLTSCLTEKPDVTREMTIIEVATIKIY